MSRTASAAATSLPSAIHAIGHHMPRRGFLAGLAKLPLVGGSVALLGKPSAVAEPVTPEMLEAYKTWLHFEQRWLAWEMAGDPVHQRRYGFGHSMMSEDSRPALSREIRQTLLYVGDSGSYHGGSNTPSASSRAALIMSAVGCDWRDREGIFNFGRA